MEYLPVYFVLITIHLPKSLLIITRQTGQDHQVGDTYRQGTTDWQVGLREATFRAFVRQGWVEPGLRENLYNADIVGGHQPTSPFGDITVLARGQLYYATGRLLFVKDQRLYDCDECVEITHPEGYGQILCLWAVRRIRHRLQNDNFRYEVEYKISPVTHGFLKPNGQFNYDIPGHTFLLNDNTKESKWRRQPNNEYLPPTHNKERYYLPPATTNPTVFYYTKKNYQYFTEKQPTVPTNLEREIELYNELLQSLKNNQKLTSTTGFVPQTTSTTTAYTKEYPKPNGSPVAKPINVNEDIPIFEETPFKPSPVYIPQTTMPFKPSTLLITTPSTKTTTSSVKPITTYITTIPTDSPMTTTPFKPSTTYITTEKFKPGTTYITTQPFKPTTTYVTKEPFKPSTTYITTQPFKPSTTDIVKSTMTEKPMKPSLIYTTMLAATTNPSQTYSDVQTTTPKSEAPIETTIFQIQETSFKPITTYATTTKKPTQEMKTESPKPSKKPFTGLPTTQFSKPTGSKPSKKPTMKSTIKSIMKSTIKSTMKSTIKSTMKSTIKTTKFRTTKLPSTRSTKKPKPTRKKPASDDIFDIFPTRKTVASAQPTEEMVYEVTEQIPPPDHVGSATENYFTKETTSATHQEQTKTPTSEDHAEYSKPSPTDSYIEVLTTTIGDVVQIETSKSTTTRYENTESPVVITETSEPTTVHLEETTTPFTTTKITETTKQQKITMTERESTINNVTQQTVTSPVSITTVLQQIPQLTTTPTTTTTFAPIQRFPPSSTTQNEIMMITMKPESAYTKPIEPEPIDENRLKPTEKVSTTTARIKTTRKQYTKFDKTTSAPTKPVTKKKQISSTTPRAYTTKKIKKYKYTKIPKRTTTTKKVEEENNKPLQITTSTTSPTTSKEKSTKKQLSTTQKQSITVIDKETTTPRKNITSTTSIPKITIQEISTVYLPSLNASTPSKQPIIKKPTKPFQKPNTTKTRVPSLHLTPPTMVPLATPDTKEIFDDIFGKYPKTTQKTSTTRRKPIPNAEVANLFTGTVRRKTTRFGKKSTLSAVETTPRSSSTTSQEDATTTEAFTMNYDFITVYPTTTKEEESNATPKIIFSGFYQPSTTAPDDTTEMPHTTVEEITTTVEEEFTKQTDDFDSNTFHYNDITTGVITTETLDERAEATTMAVVTMKEAVEVFDHLALSVLNNARVIRYLGKRKRVGKRRKKVVKKKV